MRRLIFISYRRERGYALAHLVNAELRSRGLRTFLDIAESDPGQFWQQAQAAIHTCRALVLICTNGSFEARQGDDWVLREVAEAKRLDRPIVPVFSQDFKPPSSLPALLAQALEYNGVSMDTQFHTAAFDHLSQLVGGRKRSEQRRRVAAFWGIASLVLALSLALGFRNIVQLNEQARREHAALQAATDRSEELSRDISEIEKKRAEERRDAEKRQLQDAQYRRQSEAQNAELSRDIGVIEKKRSEERLAAEKRQREAAVADEIRMENQRIADQSARFEAHERHTNCINECESTRQGKCEVSCYGKDEGARGECEATCKQYENLCKHGCPPDPF